MSLQDILARTKQASVDDFIFYQTSIANKEDKKLLINEIPNSTRWIRFFGTNEGSYTINGYIETDRFNELKDILKEDELKNFYIPYFGYIDLIYQSIEETLNDIGNVGFVSFKITALYSSNNVSISEKISNIRVIPDMSEKANLSKFTMLKNFFRTTALTIASARAKVSLALNNIDSVTASASLLSDEFLSLSTIVQEIETSIGSLIATPANLANSFNNMINTLSYSFSSIDDNLISMFDYAYLNKANEVSTSSQYLEEITKNNNYISSYIITSCVQSYYEITTRRDTVFSYEIERDIIRLNTLLDNVNLFYDENLKINTQNLIKNIITYLVNLNANALKKKTISINFDIPSEVLYYNIYGNLNNYSLFLNWNNLYQNQIVKKNSIIVYYEV